MARATLILVLQNDLHFADLSLVSVEQQTLRDFELLVLADNASSDVIRTVQTRLPLLNVPARVIWSADQNLNSSREQLIVHAALRSCSTDYLIFCDSSMILHPRFVEEHVMNQRAGQILSARRVELSSQLSNSLQTDDLRAGWLQKKYIYVLLDGIFGQSTQVSRGFYIRSPFLRRALSGLSDDIYAANFSLFREDALKLREFIESAELLNHQSLALHTGLHIRMLRNVLVQYHCNASSEAPIKIAAGVLERVKRLRYRVGELGLQPAMLEARRSSLRR